MRRRLLCILTLAAILAGCSVGDKPLPREKSDSVDTSSFSECFNEVASHSADELHSLMVLQDGKVIYEQYGTGHGPDELHVMWSASKTFTAAAVGLAVHDGLMSVDDKVVDFFDASELPQRPGRWLRELTVKDLLIMSSGLTTSLNDPLHAGRLDEPIKSILTSPLSFRPGEKWEYNSTDSYILSAIVTRVTGQKVVDLVAERLFKPMGIRRYEWSESTEGYCFGGWGLYLTTESLAKMAQLLLDGGLWNGKRLLDAAWVEEMMSPQIMQYAGRLELDPESLRAITSEDDWNLGYGYQMWCGRNGSARLDGAWGQYAVIVPSRRAVMVATAAASNNKTVLNALWQYIYPSL